MLSRALAAITADGRYGWLVAAAAVTAAAALFARAAPLAAAAAPAAPSPPVFVLAVRITLRNGGAALSTFKALWAPLAAHCARDEPETLSYELSVGEEDPREVLIFERYTRKAALTGPHQGSAAFKSFQAALAAADIIEARGRSTFFETGLGFMAK